jgi:hypothetical protein
MSIASATPSRRCPVYGIFSVSSAPCNRAVLAEAAVQRDEHARFDLAPQLHRLRAPRGSKGMRVDCPARAVAFCTALREGREISRSDRRAPISTGPCRNRWSSRAPALMSAPSSRTPMIRTSASSSTPVPSAHGRAHVLDQRLDVRAHARDAPR